MPNNDLMQLAEEAVSVEQQISDPYFIFYFIMLFSMMPISGGGWLSKRRIMAA
jgi:hypothetical protein